MNYAELIQGLLPVAAAAGVPHTELVGIAVGLIAKIQEHSSLSTEQIIEQAGITLDENKAALLADLVRLQGS